MRTINLWIFLVSIPIVFFSLFTYLYGLPLEVVLYATVLSSICIGIVLSADFYWNSQRRKEIEVIYNQVENKALWIKPLPPARDQTEDKAYKVIDRCHAVLAQQIRVQNEKMSELSDAYAMWIHQIKTPISAIDVLLQNEQDNEKNRQMKLELLRIEHYADMALQLLRLEETGNDLDLGPVDINAVVTTLVRKYRHFFIEKRIKIDLQVPNVTILSDAKWLVVILEQLLSNAIKYTKQGEIQIIYLEETSKLIVKDTGMGISPTDLPRVFEKGFTGFTGRQDLRATGIGLYLAKKAANLLQMEIVMNSQLGNGTSVTLKCQPYTNVRFRD